MGHEADLPSLAAPALRGYGLTGLAAVLVLAGLIWLALRFVRPVRSVGARRSAQRRIARHPRLAGVMARRRATGRFGGLPATLLAAAFLCVLSLWIGSVLHWLAVAPAGQLDIRIAQQMHALWTPFLLRATAHVTALGDNRLVIVVTLAVVVWMLVRGRRDLALAMAVAVVGNAISVTVLKLVFQRDRPAFAYFAESTNSFPSGHGAISVAFWATLFYVAWRAGWLRLGAALVLAPLFALVVGGSRVILAQHYLSDVVNGWLLGTLWLLAAVAISESWHERHGPHPGYSGAARRLAAALGLGALVASIWIVVSYDKLRNEPAPDRLLMGEARQGQAVRAAFWSSDGQAAVPALP